MPARTDLSRCAPAITRFRTKRSTSQGELGAATVRYPDPAAVVAPAPVQNAVAFAELAGESDAAAGVRLTEIAVVAIGLADDDGAAVLAALFVPFLALDD